ncbi:ABC transporter ATP-binding protein [Pseudactinotalea terrae]|uniref:ABC transporter ATP-binding protein n=1 Tax=Pseudactinotalea terrae TaxID=1743262 RepID=UPI0012E1BDA4|nr:ABC transporter ATP-binding protein [Pseudactinotalea terrae]
MTTISTTGLSVIDLSVGFGKGAKRTNVLDGINLDVADGEFVAVVGPSGSGKSTLLNAVAGFITPDAGSILVDGEQVTGPGPSRCVVFQEYAVFPWLTVEQNIGFGTQLRTWSGDRSQRGAIVDRYLELMGLIAFRDALPKTLSGGMRQRVAIARAYAVDPAILLMDEPFAALDAQTREHMQEALLDITRQERRTVLFVTHQVEEALYLADRVVVMGARPARITEIVEVPWRSERHHDVKLTTEFIDLRRHVEHLLHTDG